MNVFISHMDMLPAFRHVCVVEQMAARVILQFAVRDDRRSRSGNLAGRVTTADGLQFGTQLVLMLLIQPISITTFTFQ